MKFKREVTIHDVAEAAGVSLSTVSRILNDRPDVSESTRLRVRKIIDDLGFVPHVQAQRLAAGASRTIALLDPVDQRGKRVIDQIHLDFMIGAATAAGEQNYFFNVVTSSITSRNLLDIYHRVQSDGVILMEIYEDDWRVNLLRERGQPFVMIGRTAENSGLSFIELDIETAVRAALDHLVQLGHRKIGFFNFPHSLRERGYGPALRGWRGYQMAVEEHGLAPLVRETSYQPRDLAEAVRSLLDEEPGLTAAFALTDAPIAQVVSMLRDSGLRVPQDFSVAGLAIDRIAELMTPKLTAIRFPSYEMGYQAAGMLIRLLEGKASEPEQILITPELVVRESTGPA